jgi:GNAT superfamily N-acetyltransferase
MADIPTPTLRIAGLDDAEAVEALMKESAAVLFARYYDDEQTASGVRYVAEADPLLLGDGTYFVLETDGEMVACGGWSRRNREHTGSGHRDDDMRLLDPATEPARVRAMFVRADWTRRGLGRRILEECEAAARREGFTQLILNATLSGVPLYAAVGFEPTGEIVVTMPDGVSIDCVSMRKPIEPGPTDGGSR